MPKGRTPEEQSADPAAQEMLIRAEMLGIDTAFSRADANPPCNIGAAGMCCKLCGMGPCRLTKDGQRGVCGATIDTIQARNLIRAIAAGSAAHSDHGRDMAFTLKAVANHEAEGFVIRDVAKLRRVAAFYEIPIEGRSPDEIANQLADLFISQFGQQRGEVVTLIRATERRRALWREQGVMPRGIDREVVEALHRTHIGDDQEPEHILHHAVRTSLADGWGGSLIATDISDILFGTPAPLVGQANLGVLKEDMVNVVVHGHEPTLSEMMVAASQTREVTEYAEAAGAGGVNLSGICCTANEILMRQGIPAAGNFLQQELAILTGAVDAMVVDVQCIMQALVSLAERFHTKIITTSSKVRITGAMHVQFEEHRALTIAKDILKLAIDNYKNRGETQIPDVREDLIPGFSHEYVNYMLGGSYRASFRPLNDAIMAGRIRGVAGIVGCNNPRSRHDFMHTYVTEALLKQDVLVAETGCGAIASAKRGFLLGEADAANFRVAVGAAGHVVVVERPHVLSRDALRGDRAFGRRHMSELRMTQTAERDDVADGRHAGHARLVLRVNLDVTSLHLQADALGVQTSGDRSATRGHKQIVGANLLGEVSPQVGIYQTTDDANCSGGIQHMHHGVTVGRGDLDGRMGFARGGSADQ